MNGARPKVAECCFWVFKGHQTQGGNEFPSLFCKNIFNERGPFLPPWTFKMGHELNPTAYIYIYIQGVCLVYEPGKTLVPNPSKIHAHGLFELGTGLKCLYTRNEFCGHFYDAKTQFWFLFQVSTFYAKNDKRSTRTWNWKIGANACLPNQSESTPQIQKIGVSMKTLKILINKGLKIASSKSWNICRIIE